MPHVVLAGKLDMSAAAQAIDSTVRRWGRAVIKNEACWVRSDGEGLLVQGVVVEYSRPLHPVALLAHHHGDTMVRLWPPVSVEKTEPVQRWLVHIAATLVGEGLASFKGTNITEALWRDLLSGV